jgi:glutathione synthase/RimK-type ligase-like ATP-grasp enzyme
MPVYKNDGQTVITKSQRTPRFLEVRPRPFKVYLQFGVAKKNKVRPRVTVNYLRGIKNTRNKPRQQQLLHDAGIKVPQYFGGDADMAAGYLEQNGGQIVGKIENHSRGRGIKLFDNPDELSEFGWHRNNYYYQTYHDMNREWRIHVSNYHDEPVIAYRKCFRGEVVDAYRNGDMDKPWVRNMENCYFKLDGVEEDKEPWFDEMVEECKNAIDVLGMDIAGVDIGENNKVDGGDYVIYEVNSCCGMEETTRSHYEEAIEDIIDIKATRKGL